MKTDEKLGNTPVYLSGRVKNLSKTKLLKLLYLLDLSSIKKYGIPFLDLEYEVWKFGPVAGELYIDLSEGDGLALLSQYVSKDTIVMGRSTYLQTRIFAMMNFRRTILIFWNL